MGDETSQFASRFAAAVELLGALAEPRGARRGRRRAVPEASPAAVGEALDAVEAVYETGTRALRNWAEQRTAVLEQIAAMRAALARSVAGEELAAMARALLALIEAKPAAR